MLRRLGRTRIGRRVRSAPEVERIIRRSRNRRKAKWILEFVSSQTPNPNVMAMRGDGILRADSPSSIRTRFVVLTDGRSGSTLLVDELGRRWNSIRAEREIFLPIIRERFEYFEDVVTDTYMDDTGHPIVGCKILNGQVSESQLRALLQLDGMHVIILRRRNELRRHVSFQIAARTAVWSVTGVRDAGSTLEAGERSIAIEPGTFYRQMQGSARWFQTCAQASDGLPRLEVCYEDLAADLDGELRRIAEFLGAGEPDREDPPRLRKQNPESLRTLITNFDEISDFLHDVGLEEFLSEEEPSSRTGASRRQNRRLARRVERNAVSMWGNVAMDSSGIMPDPIGSSSSITTRFIVLNEGRSGSTLLVDELDRRWPQIHAEREVFHPMRREGLRWFEDVVRETFFVDRGASIVGCKIHGAQITKAQLSALVELDGMHVILLRRRDVLRRFVSERIANRTDQWEQQRGDRATEILPAELRRFNVDIPSFHMSTVASLRWFADCERISASVPTLEVWYEDLTADLDGELRRIASFLGAGPPTHEAPPLLTRQNPEPLRDLVNNYAEVSAFLVDVGLGATLTDERSTEAPAAQGDPTEEWLPCWPTKVQQVLLRAALAPATSFETRWVEWIWWRDSHFGSVDLATVYPTLHHRLRRSHGVVADLNDYRVESMRNTARKIRLFESLETTLDGLSADGIGSVLLGQTALLAMCTDQDGVGFRTLTMNGLDLTSATGDLESVVSSLLGMGWKPTATTGEDVDVVSLRRDDLELRLHRRMAPASSLEPDPRRLDTLERDLRAGLRAENRFGPLTQIPAPAELLLSIILDGLLSRPAGSIGWILDVHRLTIDDFSETDWDRFMELTSNHQLGAPVGAAVHLLAELCEDLLPPTVVERIETIGISDEQRRNFEHAMRQP